MNAKKLHTQYLSKRDYTRNNLNKMESQAKALEEVRTKLIEIRLQDNVNNETVRAIADIESALRYIDHYLNRREAAGIYTLEIGENSGKDIDEKATQAGFGRLVLNYVTDSVDGPTSIALDFNKGHPVDLKYTLAFLAEYYNHHNTPLILWDAVTTEPTADEEVRTFTVNISHHPEQILDPVAFNEYLSNKYELFIETDHWNRDEKEVDADATNLYKGFVIKQISKPGNDLVVPFEGWVKDYINNPAEEGPEAHKVRVNFSYLSLAISRLIASTLNIEQYQICGDQRIPGLYGVFEELTDEVKETLTKGINELVSLHENKLGY